MPSGNLHDVPLAWIERIAMLRDGSQLASNVGL
jgi:hypothetical protein